MGALVSLQHFLLRALQKLRIRPSSLPMFSPAGIVHVSWPISHLYSEIFVKRSYDPPVPLPAKPRIIDAGAHLGFASLYFLHRFPDSDVTSFEPNPATFAYLERNLRPFGARAHPVPKAVSTRAGTASYSIPEDNPTGVTGGLNKREEPDRRMRTHEIDCADITDYLRQRVDYLKLDIEGEEYNILRLEQVRPDIVPCMAVEFHDVARRHDEFADVLRSLKQRGYQAIDPSGTKVEELRELPRRDTVLRFYPGA